MTGDEADQTLMLCAAQWPGKITDPTLMLWRERLLEQDHGRIQRAIHRLAKSHDWWPSWSHVLEADRAEQRAIIPERALPEAVNSEPPATLAEAREALREAREYLKGKGRFTVPILEQDAPPPPPPPSPTNKDVYIPRTGLLASEFSPFNICNIIYYRNVACSRGTLLFFAAHHSRPHGTPGFFLGGCLFAFRPVGFQAV